MKLFSLEVLSGILNTMVGLSTPFLYAALGETFAQTAGVVNLGVDGIMLLSAFAAFYVALDHGQLLARPPRGRPRRPRHGPPHVAGERDPQGRAGRERHRPVHVRPRHVEPPLQGAHRHGKDHRGLQEPLRVPLLADIPFLGPILFRHDVLVYGAFLLVPFSWWILEKTSLGIKLKAVGQNPAAADSVGISVNRVRYLAVCIGATLAGVAGASLSIAQLDLFQDNLTAGQGFIAVALVYFGGWRPAGVLAGALLFSVANSFQLWMQVLGVKVPPSVAVMLPYILTILALTVTANRARQPAALNKPFERGES
jgi:ABC-type uncharacterized transport system permease subunit